MKILAQIVSYLINFNFLTNFIFQLNLMRNPIPAYHF